MNSVSAAARMICQSVSHSAPFVWAPPAGCEWAAGPNLRRKRIFNAVHKLETFRYFSFFFFAHFLWILSAFFLDLISSISSSDFFISCCRRFWTICAAQLRRGTARQMVCTKSVINTHVFE